MMLVRSPMSERKFVPTCSGDEYKICYKRVNEPDGSWHLVEFDRINIQDQINSAKPPSVQDIIARARRGDLTLLNERSSSASYVDLSELPNDFGSFFQLSLQAQLANQAAGKIVTENPVTEPVKEGVSNAQSDA